MVLRRLVIAGVLCAGALGLHADVPGSLDAVRADLKAGRADNALAKLDTILSSEASNGEAHNLRCRVMLQEERWDAAISSCEKATASESKSSDFHLWLGRAYGEKADRVNFITAYRLAKQVRQEFETAVQLDPSNADAMADLGEYYTDAPGFLGGGTDKAAGVAQKLASIAPQKAHALRAQIAESNKDYASAEREWKAAIAVAKDPARGWMDLASFYRGRQKWQQMDQAIRTGRSLDRDHGVALADGASTLIHAKHNRTMAIELLREYLASPNKSEDAPAFRAHAQLAQLLAAQGDQAAAREELAKAKALASGYSPSELVTPNTPH